MGALRSLRLSRENYNPEHRDRTVSSDRKWHWIRHPPQGFAKGSLFFPRDFLSEDDSDKKQNTQSSDESFEPYPDKK